MGCSVLGMTRGIIILFLSDLNLHYYNRIGLERPLFKYEQVVEKAIRRHSKLGPLFPNMMILLEAETSSA